MAGNNSVRGDETITFTDNMSFDGTERGGKLTTDGQLWLGATAAPHVRKSSFTSTDGSISFTFTEPTPETGLLNIEVVGGSTVGQTITGDDSVPLSPSGGNWNIFGQDFGSVSVMDTNGSGSTLNIEDRTWTTAFVVDPSATVGARGTFSTIAAAITAASNPTNIFIRPGTYTEDLTFKAGVNLIGYTGLGSVTAYPQTRITGTHTISEGSVVIQNIVLQQTSPASTVVSMSGATTILTLVNCTIIYSDQPALVGTAGNYRLYQCNTPASASGAGCLFSLTGSHGRAQNCRIENSAANSTTSTGTIEIYNSLFAEGVTTSGTGSFTGINSRLGTSDTYVFGGSGSHIISNSYIRSAAQASISVSAGTELFISNSTIDSSNSIPIAGAGIINYTNLSFADTGSTISTTTQIPHVASNDAVKVTVPGAYPYTVLPQDNVVLVDTSAARIINLNASPVTGQMVRIKDSVGSAPANNITINPAAGNIDGAASQTITIAYGSLDLCYGGSEWKIL